MFTVSNNGTATGQVAANNFGLPTSANWYYVCAWHAAAADTINIQVDNGAVSSERALNCSVKDSTL